MKIIGLSLAFTGLLGVLAYSYVTYVVTDNCRHLERVAGDREVISNLWGQVTALLESPAKLRNAGVLISSGTTGVIYAMEVPGNLGVDWEEVGIPLRFATVEIRGEKLSYGSFSMAEVERIRVGFGRRYHLVFDVKNGAAADTSPTAGDLDRAFSLSVDCGESRR